MPVHLYGNVCDMDKIMAFAKRHKLYVIEDNAEAFGGAYKGKKTGTLGHMAACSFCQNKTFTTGGEGGMVTTDDEELAWKARSFRDHGYDVKERLNLLELEQKLPYIHNMVGWNYRMTEMQSAIGLAELDRMDNWNMPRRRRNARILMDALGGLPQVKYLPIDTPERQNGWYTLAFSLDIENMQLRHPAVRRRRPAAEGAALLEGVLAAVPHGAGVHRVQCLRQLRLPVPVEGIRRSGQRGLLSSGGAQRPLARDAHLHLFRLPHLRGRRHAADRRGPGEGNCSLLSWVTKLTARFPWGTPGRAPQ